MTLTSNTAVELRSSDLTTKRETLSVYLGRGSAQVFLALGVVALIGRAVVGRFGWGDVIVVFVTAALIGVVEWIIHKFLLHAPEDSWRMRVAQTGTGHQQHHRDPTELEALLLTGIDAVTFVTGFAVIAAVWTLPISWLVGGGWLGPWITSVALAALALAHYEWVHLLVHTRYRCTSRYYKRLARNHRLHHFRNEHYWLGVTTNSGDRLLRTYPQSKSDVPLSDTARTLGSDGADRVVSSS